MERCSGKSKMNWMSLTIYAGGFLRFIMKDFDFIFDDGIVLMANNEMQARQFESEYIKNINDSVYKIKSLKNRGEIPNYACGILNLRKGINEENIIDFFSEENFFPIVISGGFLPQYLRENHYIFRIEKEDMQAVSDGNIAKKLEQFRSFIINNVNDVCATMTRLESSIAITEYDGPEDMRELFKILVGIGSTYASYLRQTESERTVVDFLNTYIMESKKRIAKISDFSDGNEIPELLSELVWEYVSGHEEVLVVNIKKIDGKAYKALQKKTEIIYDEKFYFFPPELLMDICKPLLQTMSEPELKRRLRDEEILYCNSADYTVKKSLTNIFGVRDRIRFFWILKEFLCSRDNLRLEDIFDTVSENEEGEL